MTKCVVVDYGLGNVFSVAQALKQSGSEPILTGDIAEVLNADRLVLPGVGAFGRAADRLSSLGLEEAILEFIQKERPMLGICVGMQLLLETGMEFGEHRGFGLFDGTVTKVECEDANGQAMRTPLIGWNKLLLPNGKNKDHWEGTALSCVPDDNAFYFVHSYAAHPTDRDSVLAVVKHGTSEVVAGIRRENVVGLQFHPERSGQQGLDLLANFLTL